MEQIIKLFESHKIETEVRDGRVWAKDWYMLHGIPGFEWIDTTEWTVDDANKWLGY